jgi:hypothetical protein
LGSSSARRVDSLDDWFIRDLGFNAPRELGGKEAIYLLNVCAIKPVFQDLWVP